MRTWSHRESARLNLIVEAPVDTEKKPDEQKTDQPKQDIGEIVGDLAEQPYWRTRPLRLWSSASRKRQQNRLP